MSDFSSNCYGFVYAWLKNSEEDFFKNIDDLKLRKAEIKGKIDKRIIDTSDAIKEVFSLNDFSQEYKILQLFDNEKRSQHVAFIDSSGKFYDQNGPDGEVRLKENLDDLLTQYQDLFWTAYYQVHSLSAEEENQVSLFLKDLME
jgi:hypothetical protein